MMQGEGSIRFGFYDDLRKEANNFKIHLLIISFPHSLQPYLQIPLPSESNNVSGFWQEGVGGNDNLQFVMCSSSAEERAKSIMSLNNDPEWKAQQPNSPVWDSYNEFSELMYSFELTPIRKFTPQQ